MIRRAHSSDRERVIELLKASHIAAGFDRADGPSGFVVPFQREFAERLFFLHLGARFLCLVNDVEGVAQGVLMAAAQQHPFGPVLFAHETVWWIEPEHRGFAAVKMIDEYETWAVSLGCASVGMAGIGEDPEVAKLYLRRGYLKAETHFLKPLRSVA